MVAMAVAMTAAMAVARRWRRAAFIVIGDIKGVKYLFCLQGFKVLFQRRIYSTPTIDFFVRSVLFFASARIFFATARKN